MSRVYTVKSNARRDCRKLGLNPDLVKEVKGGWAIDYPDVPESKAPKPTKIEKPAKAPKAKKAPKAVKPKPDKAPKAARIPRAPKPAREPKAKREGDPKKDRLIAMLADWTLLSELMAAMDWQAHTVRGALSTAAKARGISIERRRVDGVTSYRVSSDVAEKAV